MKISRVKAYKNYKILLDGKWFFVYKDGRGGLHSSVTTSDVQVYKLIELEELTDEDAKLLSWKICHRDTFEP